MAVILGIVILVVVLVAQRLGAGGEDQQKRPQVAIEDTPDEPLDFGFKRSWVAVQAEATAAVADALALRDVRVANWASGLNAAGAYPEPFVFVTPPTQGWVLAVGAGLPEPIGGEGGNSTWEELIRELAARFGVAYFFATHRVSDYVAWARVDGVDTRLFCWAGEVLAERGRPTSEETDLLEAYRAAKNGDGRDPQEDDVITMAERWTVSPMALEGMALGLSVGLVGKR